MCAWVWQLLAKSRKEFKVRAAGRGTLTQRWADFSFEFEAPLAPPIFRYRL